MTVAEEILDVFASRGHAAYFGEAVSTTEHCLQAAYFASLESASPALVIAALLHDVGHLIEDVPDEITAWKVDARHEEVGARWLAQRFGREVSEPVRLHVPAKRYLCATDRDYVAILSPASVVTLGLQGGPMSAREIALFETEPFHREAVRVRRWDDRGKVAGLQTPNLHDYRILLGALTAI